jgi:hypothetical protein
MNNYPVMITDGFYSNPDKVREWALSLEYSDSDKTYPGRRTAPLSEIDRDFFHCSVTKFLSLYYDLTNIYEYEVYSAFQLIDPFSPDKSSPSNLGWIHQDSGDVSLAGILYLNQTPSSGTNIYEPKEGIDPFDDQEQRHKLYGENIIDDDYISAIKRHRDSFNETITVSNKYNRLLSFGSELWHGVDNFHNDEPRLTQVFFVKKFNYTVPTPIERIRYWETELGDRNA